MATISLNSPGVHVTAVASAGALQFYPFGSVFMLGSAPGPAPGTEIPPIDYQRSIVRVTGEPGISDGADGDIAIFDRLLYPPKVLGAWSAPTPIDYGHSLIRTAIAPTSADGNNGDLAYYGSMVVGPKAAGVWPTATTGKVDVTTPIVNCLFHFEEPTTSAPNGYQAVENDIIIVPAADKYEVWKYASNAWTKAGELTATGVTAITPPASVGHVLLDASPGNVGFYYTSPVATAPTGTYATGDVLLVPMQDKFDVFTFTSGSSGSWTKYGSSIAAPGVVAIPPPVAIEKETYINEPKAIGSYAQFTSIFGATSPSAKAVESFFNSNRSGALYFVRVDSLAGSPNIAKVHDALMGIRNLGYESGILIAPELFQTMNQSQRIQLAAELETFCGGLESPWMAIVDPGPPTEINTASKAIAERRQITSTLGDLSFYYPYVQVSDTVAGIVNVPPSPFVAAAMLSAWSGGDYGDVPAGMNFPLRIATGLADYVVEADRGNANDNGVNIIRFIPNQGYLIYGARTLSQFEGLLFVNSVASVKAIVQRLTQGLQPYIFTRLRGVIDNVFGVLGAVESILYNAWADGLLFGDTPGAAYAAQIIGETTISPGRAVINILVDIAPAFALERINVEVRVTTPGQVGVTLSNLTPVAVGA